jgi:hypothetical protein
VPPTLRQIFAYSGVLKPKAGDRGTFALIDHALRLAGTTKPLRLCYVPTAVRVEPGDNGGYTERPVNPRLL